MSTDPVLSEIEIRMNTDIASNGERDVEAHARDLIPGWEPRAQERYYERTELSTVRKWLKARQLSIVCTRWNGSG